MRARIVITCLISLTACLNAGKPPEAGLVEELDAGPSRRRQRIDAGQTSGPGTFRFVVSRDQFVRDGGYPFPPPQMGAPAFVDGWAVQFDHLLVIIDKIALYEDPDRSASDPTQVGAKVAELRGPWMVDLRLPGRSAADGGTPDAGAPDGGAPDGRAPDGGADGDTGDLPIVLATLGDQNLAGHLPFDPNKRYALSYEIIPSRSARSVNLDLDGEARRSEMAAGGYGVWYIGLANWRGTPESCTSTDSQFDFTRVPTAVTFKLGFRTPTTYLNCQNPDLPGSGIGSEPHPRGVKVSSVAQTVVQLTVRADQLFWENYDGADAPLHFDQLAIAARRSLSGPWVLGPAEEDRPGRGGIVNQNYTAFGVPWRWCRGDLTGYTPPDNNTRMDFEGGQFYDPTLPRNLMSTTSYRDYYDLASHIQSGQGYLNGRGRCAVQRQFPSRP